MQIPREKLTIFKGKMLGKGGSAQVFLGEYEGCEVAVKVISAVSGTTTEMEKIKKTVNREVLINAKLRSNHIVHFYGFYEDPSVHHEMGLVMELMDNSLHKKLVSYREKRKTVLKEAPTLFLEWAWHMAGGLAYLASQKICHRDVKSANFLFDEKKRLRVADFGLAMTTSDTFSASLSHTMMGGTAPWMSPELLSFDADSDDEGKAGDSSKPPYTESSDVYAFGVVLWEIVTCQTPWAEKNFNSIRKRVLRGERPSLPANCVGEYRKLIQACWSQDPTKRPTFSFIQNHVRKLQESAAPAPAPPREAPAPASVFTSTDKGSPSPLPTSPPIDDQWHVGLLGWFHGLGLSNDSKDGNGNRRFQPKFPVTKGDLLALTALLLWDCNISGTNKYTLARSVHLTILAL